ncbi:protease inhibitor I42 family protein [Nitriliruptor alkaliphilus]|uniref:protease inhibitor I42 family protein n=1 Tax=Nitriliruptor alkaliphilus TaxID=427918 RepID=UPI0006964A92|nr:protease inhibitor I42 family protein [Nitriliruptor alkaliphilus]
MEPTRRPVAVLLLVAASVLALGGCGGDRAPWDDAAPVRDGDTVAVGERIVLLVGENQSVGDRISVVREPDPGVLRPVGSGIHRERKDEELLGVGHQRWYAFEAVGTGTGELVLFNCWRCDPEQPNDDPQTREIALVVQVED